MKELDQLVQELAEARAAIRVLHPLVQHGNPCPSPHGSEPCMLREAIDLPAVKRAMEVE